MGTWHRPGEPYDASKVHEDIKYTAEDDKAIDDWVSDHVETTWHSLGTCAMKPREQGGVVDNRLNVYGTENLKCVDLSICPVSLRRSLEPFGCAETDAAGVGQPRNEHLFRLRCWSARRARTSSPRTSGSSCVSRTRPFRTHPSRLASPQPSLCGKLLEAS